VISHDADPDVTLTLDYLATQSGGVKSSWYTPLTALINSLPDWAITLLIDQSIDSGDKPLWQIEYTGNAPSDLDISKDNGMTIMKMLSRKLKVKSRKLKVKSRKLKVES